MKAKAEKFSKSKKRVKTEPLTLRSGSSLNRLAVVATGFVVPPIELQIGIEKLQSAGWHVDVHPNVFLQDGFFAGSDESRARSFWETARRKDLAGIWCARGGYGSIRILSWLKKWTEQKGAPASKVLIGDSDLTVLHDFVRKHWKWKTIHAPMPSVRSFSLMAPTEWSATVSAVKSAIDGVPPVYEMGGRVWNEPWGSEFRLELLSGKVRGDLRAPLVGGNLTVLASALGTPFFVKPPRCILFLEDITEAYYRLDRMVQQLLLAGGLDRVEAIVLGNFMDCRDNGGLTLKERPADQVMESVLRKPSLDLLVPIRDELSEREALLAIFRPVVERLKIPIWIGLPAGHGPDRCPLWLGATYRLTREGRFTGLS